MNEVGGQPVAGGALSLREDPFRLTPDRRFIFSTDAFRRAFDGMLGSIRERRGIVLLTGPSGTGKTTLLKALQEELQSDGAIIFLRFHPNLTVDLISSCLTELGTPEIPVEESARVRALIDLV
jgi:type II secretory pathway predicted ATPase ExeA